MNLSMPLRKRKKGNSMEKADPNVVEIFSDYV
jgi:hypothetical protein